VSSRWLPNINWVRAIVCPAVVFIATSLDRGYQTDFWHHIACGREIARTGTIVDAEPFAFTVVGQPARDANWLTQLTYFRLHEIGGLALVQTVNSLMLAIAAGGLVWICRRRGGSMLVAAGVSVFAFAGIWQTLLIRPQSVSILLFVTLYAILLEAEQRRRLLALPPVLMALWANVHGGFPIGLLLIGAFITGVIAERIVGSLRKRFASSRPAGWDPRPADVAEDAALGIRRGRGLLRGLIACLAACLAATLVNPYGAGIYKYVVALSATASDRQVEEWMPPSMNLWVGRVWLASVAGLILLLAFAPRRPRTRELIAAMCFLPLACASVRMVPWWLLAVSPVAAMIIGRNLALAACPKRSAAPRPSFAAGAMLAAIVAVVALSTPWLEGYNPVFGTLRPAARPEANIQAMVDRIKPHGPTRSSRVFSRLEWGEYLVWSAHPKASVFMDGRIEIYPDDVWQQYHAITCARADWQSILDAHGVDYLLLDTAFHGELMPRVESSERWRRIDAAGPAVLYERGPAFDVAATDVHAVP
jgi:hypothetical protein